MEDHAGEPKGRQSELLLKEGDGTLDDVDRSLIMAGAEIKRVGNAATPFLKVMM